MKQPISAVGGLQPRRCFAKTGEDHTARVGLNDAGDDHFDVFSDPSPGMINYNHGSIIQVRHALSRLFPFP